MSDTAHVFVAEPVFGAVVGPIDLHIHESWMCEGACTFHAPSDHHMRDWPMVVRLDKQSLVERTCEHGVGHPDPDSLAYYEGIGKGTLGIHGCDGCCRAPADDASSQQ